MPTPTATLTDRPAISSGQATEILIVRHGRTRGPKIRFRRFRPAYYQPMFDDIAERWPRLHEHFRFWETGTPQPDLDRVAAVVFLLQDPLLESFPDCFQDAVRLASRASEFGAHIVNPPEALSNTIKTNQSRLWRNAGLPTPPCLPFCSIDELHAVAAEFDGPMIIKADTEHSQHGAMLLQGLDALMRVPADQLPFPGSISPVIDTRAGFRETDPRSPYATHFHKKRVMVFGDHVRNNHVFFSEQPIVGCVSSSFGHFRSMNPIRRVIGNHRCRSHIECDLRFHHSDSDDADMMRRAAKALGIEYCAIDYSSHADGSIVLWEANPHFSLHRWPIAVLSRQRQLGVRTPNLHESAAQFFGDLLGKDGQ